jgi:hypothetical protein
MRGRAVLSRGRSYVKTESADVGIGFPRASVAVALATLVLPAQARPRVPPCRCPGGKSGAAAHARVVSADFELAGGYIRTSGTGTQILNADQGRPTNHQARPQLGRPVRRDGQRP